MSGSSLFFALGKRRGEKARQDKWSSAFTLIELLSVIAILVVLAALLVPAVKSSIRRSQAAVCSSNLRQIWVASLNYATDTGYLPVAGSTSTGANRWQSTLVDGGYLSDYRVTLCPTLIRKNAGPISAKTIPPANQGYGMGLWTGFFSTKPIRLAQLAHPSTYAIMGDSVNMSGYGSPQQICWLTSTNGGSRDNIVDLRHSDRANILFADGHVEALAAPRIELLGKPNPTNSNDFNWLNYRYYTNSQK